LILVFEVEEVNDQNNSQRAILNLISNNLLIEETFLSFGETIVGKLQEIKLKFEHLFWLRLDQFKKKNLPSETKPHRGK